MSDEIKEKLSALEFGQSITIPWDQCGKKRLREPGACGFDEKIFDMEPTPAGMKLTRVL